MQWVTKKGNNREFVGVRQTERPPESKDGGRNTDDSHACMHPHADVFFPWHTSSSVVSKCKVRTMSTPYEVLSSLTTSTAPHSAAATKATIKKMDRIILREKNTVSAGQRMDCGRRIMNVSGQQEVGIGMLLLTLLPDHTTNFVCWNIYGGAWRQAGTFRL
jgi:hypothetical protein